MTTTPNSKAETQKVKDMDNDTLLEANEYYSELYGEALNKWDQDAMEIYLKKWEKVEREIIKRGLMEKVGW